jgi:hypothetical protein
MSAIAVTAPVTIKERLNVRGNHFALLAKLFIRCPTLSPSRRAPLLTTPGP